MNADSVQPALRNFMTVYKNCRFIFTCNFKNKIIPRLQSRATKTSKLSIIKEEVYDAMMTRLVMFLQKKT